MRRKSERNKAKSSPEKKPEKPTRKSTRRRAKKSPSTSPDRETSNDADGPAIEKESSSHKIQTRGQVKEIPETIVEEAESKVTSTEQVNEEMIVEDSVWKVSRQDASPGEIQKLRLCRQRNLSETSSEASTTMSRKRLNRLQEGSESGSVAEEADSADERVAKVATPDVTDDTSLTINKLETTGEEVSHRMENPPAQQTYDLSDDVKRNVDCQDGGGTSYRQDGGGKVDHVDDNPADDVKLQDHVDDGNLPPIVSAADVSAENEEGESRDNANQDRDKEYQKSPESEQKSLESEEHREIQQETLESEKIEEKSEKSEEKSEEVEEKSEKSDEKPENEEVPAKVEKEEESDKKSEKVEEQVEEGVKPEEQREIEEKCEEVEEKKPEKSDDKESPAKSEESAKSDDEKSRKDSKSRDSSPSSDDRSRRSSRSSRRKHRDKYRDSSNSDSGDSEEESGRRRRGKEEEVKRDEVVEKSEEEREVKEQEKKDEKCEEEVPAKKEEKSVESEKMEVEKTQGSNNVCRPAKVNLKRSFTSRISTDESNKKDDADGVNDATQDKENHATDETKVAPKRRRWGAVLSTDTAPVLSISTDSLKALVPGAKPLSLNEVRLTKDDDEDRERRKEKKNPSVEREKTKDEPKANNDTSKDNHLGARRKISIVRDTPQLISPSPPQAQPTSILLIKNLVRPFTLNQIKELLSRTGTIVENGFWMDRIKSKCFVEYSNEDQAFETRQALHGISWPVSNPKKLLVEYSTKEEMEKVKETSKDQPPLRKVETSSGADAWQQDWGRDEKTNSTTKVTVVREWDLGKEDGQHLLPKDKDKEKKDLDKKRRQRSRSPTLEAHLPAPARKFKKKEDEPPPAKLLDDLFRKTKATPCIYWLPLTNDQIVVKEEMRRQHMAEHARRLEEMRRAERNRDSRRRRSPRK